MASNWKCLIHDSQLSKKTCKRVPTDNHPLKGISVMLISSKEKQKIDSLSDPLSITLEGYDPLSMFAEEHPLATTPKDVYEKTKSNEWADTWQSRRAAILIRYTTAEKLSIISSFLPGGEKMIMKTQTCVVDQVKTRLEQLDDFEEGSVRQMLNLSQQEYVSRIDMLNRELVQAWNTEQRVKALKIAIQCSKLLVDTSVMQFYPSKFVLITDILDIFGKLVYERLRTKAEYYEPGSRRATSLPENFTPDMVPEAAKETCQNWLYKMASIRELVPRLYVEMSLLKCYSFLTRHEFGSALIRITSMIRGIGHPLSAAYARFYLCRVGLTLNTANKEYFVHNINDFILTYPQIFSSCVRSELQIQHIDMNTYVNLYSPSIDWMLYGLVHWSNMSTAFLDKLVEQCKNTTNSNMLLRSIMSSFKPDYITCRAMQFLEMISNTDTDDAVVSEMLGTLGKRVCSGGGSADDKALLAAAWRTIRQFKNLQHYLACAEPWIQFAAIHFSVQQINWLLGDIISSVMKSDDSIDLHYAQLQVILKKVVTHTTDIEGLFTMENLLSTLNLFKAGPIQVEVCKILLTAYQNQQDCPNTDQTVINYLMHICVILHKSVNALTVDDELKSIGELVCGFVRHVSYGRDFEKQLDFYVEARAAFYKLEMVHVILVQYVNSLSVETRRIVSGKHTRKSGWFVHACAAYCYVTIPALDCPFTKVQLYLLSGQVALLNHCRGQAEDCLKEALTLLSEVPSKRMIDGQLRTTDAFLVAYLSSFLSTLLVVPDRAGAGNELYLVKGLIKMLNRLSWEATDPSRYTLLLKSIDLLANMAQDTYLYHVGKVDSNDTLYGSEVSFIAEINKMCALLVDEILSVLKQLGEENEHHKQSTLALELFWRVAIRTDTNNKETEILAVNLWNLAHKHRSCVDFKMANKQMQSLQLRNGSSGLYTDILSKLKV